MLAMHDHDHDHDDDDDDDGDDDGDDDDDDDGDDDDDDDDVCSCSLFNKGAWNETVCGWLSKGSRINFIIIGNVLHISYHHTFTSVDDLTFRSEVSWQLSLGVKSSH